MIKMEDSNLNVDDVPNAVKFHPSMIQTPWSDAAMSQAPGSVAWTDPMSSWLTPTNCARGTCTSRPRFSERQIESSIMKLKPVTWRTYDDKGVTLLFGAFFSRSNFDNVQKLIRYAIFVESDGRYKIGNQGDSEVIRLMESVYSEKAKNLPENVLSVGTLESRIRNEVARLNDLTVKEAVPMILDAIQQRDTYVHQLAQGLGTTSIDRPTPTSTNVTGIKTYRAIEDVSGGATTMRYGQQV